jgi:hypothetical protein
MKSCKILHRVAIFKIISQIQRMSNPFSAGGGGTHFEARVVAFCLAATVCEAAFRGLRAEFVSRVSTQRADFGEYLDDVILCGPRAEGKDASLHLQVKKTLSFTKSDEPWKEVVIAAWQTANNLQQSWRFDWEPPKAVLRDVWTIDWILGC